MWVLNNFNQNGNEIAYVMPTRYKIFLSKRALPPYNPRHKAGIHVPNLLLFRWMYTQVPVPSLTWSLLSHHVMWWTIQGGDSPLVTQCMLSVDRVVLARNIACRVWGQPTCETTGIVLAYLHTGRGWLPVEQFNRADRPGRLGIQILSA